MGLGGGSGKDLNRVVFLCVHQNRSRLLGMMATTSVPANTGRQRQTWSVLVSSGHPGLHSIFQGYMVRHCLKKAWTSCWGDGLVVKSTRSYCRGPGFIPSTHMGLYNYPKLQSWGSDAILPLGATSMHVTTYIHAGKTPSHKIKHTIRI